MEARLMLFVEDAEKSLLWLIQILSFMVDIKERYKWQMNRREFLRAVPALLGAAVVAIKTGGMIKGNTDRYTATYSEPLDPVKVCGIRTPPMRASTITNTCDYVVVYDDSSSSNIKITPITYD